MSNVIVAIGAGQIGQAIARRVGVGKQVVLADRSETTANAAAEVMTNAGYQVSVATVDVSSRETVRALVAGHDPACGPLRYGGGARRAWARHRPRWIRCCHLVAVGASAARAHE